MLLRSLFVLSLIVLLTTTSQAQSSEKSSERKWYDKISLRGYFQLRYNRLLETNDKLKCEQCDRSIGENGGLFIRRARLILSGQITDNVFMYIQPDFAASAGDLNYFQIRDAYFDLSLDSAREFRIRLGQSKIPFGYENLQSSQNRLPLDRADALNSGVPNERDLGVLAYWAPADVRKLYSDMNAKGLKGSGDYGVVGFGVYNGQGTNKVEANNSLHVVARVSYPLQFSGQILELGVQAYHGKFVLPSTTSGVLKATEYLDERTAVSIALAPQPFGLLAEYNWGHGPRFMAKDPTDSTSKNRIIGSTVVGGFVTLFYKWTMMQMPFIFYTRAQAYQGGKKLELDARYCDMKELEFGLEWQQSSALELTAAYVMSERNNSDAANVANNQKGNYLRLQAQFNF